MRNFLGSLATLGAICLAAVFFCTGCSSDAKPEQKHVVKVLDNTPEESALKKLPGSKGEGRFFVIVELPNELCEKIVLSASEPGQTFEKTAIRTPNEAFYHLNRSINMADTPKYLAMYKSPDGRSLFIFSAPNTKMDTDRKMHPFATGIIITENGELCFYPKQP